jgi:putative peptidoglycan lipid II flippase
MNSQRRFGVPAAMNVVMNGLAAVLIITRGQDDIRVAAFAYVLGAAAQLLFMVVMSGRTGLRLRPVAAPFDREVRELGRISVRPITAAGLNPLARLVEQAVISFLPSGSITIVNYANRLISAIGGTVLFRSVMVVLLPRMTSAWHDEDPEQVRSLVRRGVLLMLRLAVPLTALMCVLGVPGAVVVFHRGEFTREAAVLLGITLALYATSLVGQAVQRALLAPFYAALSMKVPFRNSVYGVLANLALLPPVVFFLRDQELGALAGVALAFSAAQYVNVGHAAWHLRKLVGRVRDRSLVLSAWTLAAAGLVQSAVLGAGGLLLGVFDERDRVDLFVRTGLVSLAGLGVFVGIVAAVDRIGRVRRRRAAALSGIS